MRGILFIENLYHQVVLGRKTQTRRSGGLEEVNDNPDNWEFNGHVLTIQMFPENATGLTEITFITKDYIHDGDYAYKKEVVCKPRYKPGEVLYIKEPYMGQSGHYSYKYDLKPNSPLRESVNSFKWKNKLFMPAEAGRTFIKITNIRCERLHDISDADCIAEGIEQVNQGAIRPKVFKDYQFIGKSQNEKGSFLSLYKFANKVKDVPNLWVWVYSFEYLTNYTPDAHK